MPVLLETGGRGASLFTSAFAEAVADLRGERDRLRIGVGDRLAVAEEECPGHVEARLITV